MNSLSAQFLFNKPLHRISRNFVGDKDTMCRCAYYVYLDTCIPISLFFSGNFAPFRFRSLASFEYTAALKQFVSFSLQHLN